MYNRRHGSIRILRIPICIWRTSIRTSTLTKEVRPPDWSTSTIGIRELHRTLPQLQSLPTRTNWTSRVGQIPWRTSMKGIYQAIKFSISITILLCKEKGWEVTTSSGLPLLEQDHHQKPISVTVDQWTSRQTQRSKDLFQIWCTMGIQQYGNQRRR